MNKLFIAKGHGMSNKEFTEALILIVIIIIFMCLIAFMVIGWIYISKKIMFQLGLKTRNKIINYRSNKEKSEKDGKSNKESNVNHQK